MTDQVQCPNCGGYKVNTTTDKVDRKSGNAVPGCGVLFVLFFFAVIGWLLGVGLNDAAYALCGLLITGTFIWGLSTYLKADKIKRYHHTCWLCGYKWIRREDEPLPPVNIRPDLIAKGEQKLEEEAAEEEQRQHAAALFYSQKK
jgi:transcription elongation factor Elf1